MPPPLLSAPLLLLLLLLLPGTPAPAPVPRFTVTVLAHRRAASLDRLLSSLFAVDYLNTTVALSLRVDGGADPAVRRLADAAARRWEVTHGGPARVTAETERRGVRRMWLEAWDPQTDDEYNLIFEVHILHTVYHVYDHGFCFLPFFFFICITPILIYMYVGFGPPNKS
jgi:hypothetical protein